MRFAALFLLPAVLGAPSALADSQHDCANQANISAKIAGCSELIRKNSRDASAYFNRGSALYANGETDRALADYDKAIELDPNYAAAYDKRGSAYAAKGDYAHAVADVTRAEELAKVAKVIQASAQAAHMHVPKPKPVAKVHVRRIIEGATAETQALPAFSASYQ